MRSSSADEARAPVCLLGVPVDVFLRSQQHTDDLVRELWLMSLGEESPEGPFRMLVEAAEAYAAAGLKVRHDTLQSVLAAREAGRSMVDLEFTAPVSAADTTEAWAGLLDRMDDLCRAGSLLTLACTPDLLLFRQWCVGETVRQLRQGAAPTPFAAWSERGWTAGHPTGT